jgi:hypothetical protein
MRRTVVVVVAVVAAGALVVVGLRAWVSPAHDAHRPVPAPAVEPQPHRPRDTAGPARVVNGVPSGWAHSPAGARAAAISAVAMTGTIARAGFVTRRDLVIALASHAYGPTLADSSGEQIDTMLRELGPAGVSMDTIVFHELPLTAHVRHADTTRARVAVWSVTVLGVLGRGAPRQVWRTVTVDLVWENQDWRIDRWTAVAGPTPILDAHAAVATVGEIASVSAWPSIEGTG